MVKISIKDLQISFGNVESLRNVSLDIPANQILTIIGPANSGKTTLLRAINRMHDLTPSARISGSIHMDGKDIYRDFDPVSLRRNVGLIFALPLPLPLTVFENVVYGLRRQGINDKKVLQEKVESSLKDAYLWDEIKDRLNDQAMKLSGGQQQRLCIARTLAMSPQVILFDEPCSALDPISTSKIEEAMFELKKRYTLVLVTNNTKQAARTGDQTAFFLMGDLVEVGPTAQLFTTPKDTRTNDYISGRFG